MEQPGPARREPGSILHGDAVWDRPAMRPHGSGARPRSFPAPSHSHARSVACDRPGPPGACVHAPGAVPPGRAPCLGRIEEAGCRTDARGVSVSEVAPCKRATGDHPLLVPLSPRLSRAGVEVLILVHAPCMQTPCLLHPLGGWAQLMRDALPS